MKQIINLLKGIYLNRPSPISVSVNLTNKCNQHCIYCEIGQGLVKNKKSPLLAMDDLKWIIDEMNRSGISTLSLGGGEPLLFKEVFDVIKYAHEFGIISSILTNGMLLPHFSQDKIELLKECETAISVSIDSFSPDKEEHIRGIKNALPLAIEGIEILVKHRIPVNIMTTISAHNYQDLFNVAVNANQLGVNSVVFQPVIFVSNFPEVEPITNKKSLNVRPEHLPKIEDQFQRIMDFERNNNIYTNIDVLQKWFPYYIQTLSSGKNGAFFFKNIAKQYWCAPLYFTIAVNYYGDILPCNMLKSTKSIMDRDNDNKSLLEMWNNSCQPIRSMIEEGQYPDACKSCVCGFDFNVLCSALKHPSNNFNLLSKVVISNCKRQIRKNRKQNIGD